jgi:hypothetical protein
VQNSSLSADGFAESGKHGGIGAKEFFQCRWLRWIGQTSDVPQKVCNTVRYVQMGIAESCTKPQNVIAFLAPSAMRDIINHHMQPLHRASCNSVPFIVS